MPKSCMQGTTRRPVAVAPVKTARAGQCDCRPAEPLLLSSASACCQASLCAHRQLDDGARAVQVGQEDVVRLQVLEERNSINKRCNRYHCQSHEEGHIPQNAIDPALNGPSPSTADPRPVIPIQELCSLLRHR